MSSITEIEGDLFDAPDGATLVHACNCQGSWGKGIAAAFRAKYPAAYTIYRTHCQTHHRTATNNKPNQKGESRKKGTTTTTQTRRPVYPEGTALIIPPQPEDPGQPPPPSSPSLPDALSSGGGDSKERTRTRKRHWIVCLFTSYRYGPRGRSGVETILHNTRAALGDLKAQLEKIDCHAGDGEGGGRGGINAGVGTGAGGTDTPGPLFACRLNAGLFGVPWEQTKGMMEESGLRVTVVRPPGEE